MGDGRKYDIDDQVTFTLEGKKYKGIVHGVRYQDDGVGRHDFEYIIIPLNEHKAWWNIERNNQKHIKAENHHLVKPLPDLSQQILIDTDLE